LSSFTEIEIILAKHLSGLKPSALFIDIDGVITIERGSCDLDLEVINMLRRLMYYKVSVHLVSGNAYPTVLALQRYLGFSPSFIAENGCVIHVNNELIKLCKETLDEVADEIEKFFSLKKSPSNLYRLCDRALHIPEHLKADHKSIRRLERTIMERYPHINAHYTGYALHIYPRYCSKGIAIKILAERLRIDLEKAIAIGDSIVDIDMIKSVGIGVAVGDADEEVKRAAKIALPYRASQSTKCLLSALQNYLTRIS